MDIELKYKTDFTTYRTLVLDKNFRSARLALRGFLTLALDLCHPNGTLLVDRRVWKELFGFKKQHMVAVLDDFVKFGIGTVRQTDSNGNPLVNYQYILTFNDPELWFNNKNQSEIFKEVEQLENKFSPSTVRNTLDKRVIELWKKHYPELVEEDATKHDQKFAPDTKIITPDFNTDVIGYMFSFAGDKDESFIKEAFDKGLLGDIPFAKEVAIKLKAGQVLPQSSLQGAYKAILKGDRVDLSNEERRPFLMSEFKKVFPTYTAKELLELVYMAENKEFDKIRALLGKKTVDIPEMSARLSTTRKSGTKAGTASVKPKKEKVVKVKAPKINPFDSSLDTGFISDTSKKDTKLVPPQEAVVSDGQKEVKRESFMKPIEEPKKVDLKQLKEMLEKQINPTLATPKEESHPMLVYPYTLVWSLQSIAPEDREKFVPSEKDKAMIALVVKNYARQALVGLREIGKLELAEKLKNDQDSLAKMFRIMCYFGADTKNWTDSQLEYFIQDFDDHDWITPIGGYLR